ncbi:MAG: FmdE family protein [Methanomicrobiales archaeon]
MTAHTDNSSNLAAIMDKARINSKLQSYVQGTVTLHSYPAPGVLIGAIMVDYALELLGTTPDEKLFAVCETPKCLPDAIQAIAHCTTGNKRLQVLPIGKFAITMNISSKEAAIDAVRVFVDSQKLEDYKTINTWFINSPVYDRHTMAELLQEEIFTAGRNILSFERVIVKTSQKQKWNSVTCPECGDMVPDYMLENNKCAACGSKGYYDKIKG